MAKMTDEMRKEFFALMHRYKQLQQEFLSIPDNEEILIEEAEQITNAYEHLKEHVANILLDFYELGFITIE